MIWVDVDRPHATVTVTGTGRRVVVRAPGTMTRSSLDAALERCGAGRAPGHHAEMSVGWLRARVGTDLAWLTASRSLLDEDGEWLHCPVIWDDGVSSASLPSES